MLGYIGYRQIFVVNTIHESAQVLFIDENVTIDSLSYQLKEEGILGDRRSFDLVAQLMKFDQPKPGRYRIPVALNNRSLVGLLRSGQQEAVNLTISSARTIEEIAAIAAGKLSYDSIQIASQLTDSVWLMGHGLSRADVISIIIPNTYQFFWNTSPLDFAERMVKEHRKFWEAGDRQSKLSALSMTKSEVATLASIVEKESIQQEERPRIAGVYLNRLKRDIHLQADPTVVFGVGDFTIRRVLNRHLEHDSPYNTYMYPGLPPGPICMPSISSLDAVLNAEEHDYLFFCAKPGYNGAHLFAKTNAEHERNARTYRRWLNKEGIR